VGNYAYHATQRRAVVSAGSNTFGYDANGNMNVRNGANIGYTSYNLPNVINAPGGYSSTISYGAFRNRFKQVAIGPQGTETTIYVAGLLEKVTNAQGTHYRHSIQGGRGTAAIHSRTVGGSNTTFYLHQDHLGSPELITSSSGIVLVRPSFSAYGERRDGTDWDGAISSADLNTLAGISRRGFTGHEHLDAVGLIHMNGRVFEPVAGRFLSRDPFIDGVASSQGMNGYAYVHNSPLSFVDPSGFNCEPLPGMSDEEAGAYVTRCTAEYDSAGWGSLRENERWCASMDFNCQQANWTQYQASVYEAAIHYYGRDWVQDQQNARPATPFDGDGVLVRASRWGGVEHMSWLPGLASLSGRTEGMATATLPDGTRIVLGRTASHIAATPPEQLAIRLRISAQAGGIVFSLLEAAGALPEIEFVETYRREVGAVQIFLGGWTGLQGLLVTPAAATGSAIIVPVMFIGGGAFSITRGIDNMTGGAITQFATDAMCYRFGGCAR
jgi:RHS repeat-associated protein